MEETRENKTRSYLALGDSYTIGTAIKFPDNYPNQIKDSLEKRLNISLNVKIIAQNSWRTDDLMRGIKRTDLNEKYDLVSLLIGVNNQYQGLPIETYKEEFRELVDTAIKYAGGDKNKIFVFSIPNYGYTPFGKEKKEKITKELGLFNAAADSICKSLEVDYFNITPITCMVEGDPLYYASDSLHPSAQQYAKWLEPYYERIESKINF